jgi:hypothetical protein
MQFTIAIWITASTTGVIGTTYVGLKKFALKAGLDPVKNSVSVEMN